MNGKDREMIARLDQKVKDIKDDVSEIKDICSNLKDCTGKLGLQSAKLETIMTNHLRHHEEANIWIRWVPSVVAVGIASIAFIFSVV